MSMRDDATDDSIDVLIGGTARSLTEGRPSMSLRAAVRHRIDRPASEWRIAPSVGGLSAAALTAVAILWIVGDPPPPDGAVARAPMAPPPLPLAVDRPRQPTAPVRAELPQRPAGERAARPQAPSPMVGPAVGPAVIALPLVRLVEEPSITVERVEIQPLSTEPLLTRQLSTGLLEMDPMETPMPLRAERLEIEPITIQ
jgi:hypothetical protein